MRRYLLITAALGLASLAAGCGSQSYEAATKSQVQAMAGALSAYDRSAPKDLASQATVCSDAAASLKSHEPKPAPTSSLSAERKTASELRAGYSEAYAGFVDCARAARTLDYPLMAQALDEIGSANESFKRARSLDH